MKRILIIIISLLMVSCNGKSDAEKAQEQADRLVQEALRKAELAQADAEARAKELTEKAEAIALNKIAEAEQEKLDIEKERQILTEEKQSNLQHKPNAGLRKYNGFYVNDRSSNMGALIFIDGKLSFFSLQDFTSTYKNEEYNTNGITEDGLFNITGKYYKDRKGKVYVKETILKEGKPNIVNGVCVSIDRIGNIFRRYDSFKELMESERNWNYPLDDLIKDVKNDYGRSNAEIEKAINRKDFYKCAAFVNAEFYGERFSFKKILESIILMN